eukprot:4357821-Alexandrium_andersonii.AAC.1
MNSQAAPEPTPTPMQTPPTTSINNTHQATTATPPPTAAINRPTAPTLATQKHAHTMPTRLCARA